MNVFEKSLAALDKFLETTPKEELDRIAAEVRVGNAEGPTIGEILEAYYRVECDPYEHEFVEVQQTTISINGDIITTSWCQCRFCGALAVNPPKE